MDSVVKSADRVVTVLETLAATPTGLSFTDLLTKLGLPRSSLHGLLQTLVRSKMVVYEAESKRYHFGPKIWELSMAYYHRIHLVPIAWPYLQRLRDAFDQTVQMGVLDGTDILYVAKVESSHPLQLVSHVGSRLPAYATGLGKALLATQDLDTLEKTWREHPFQSFTDVTITTFDALRGELDKIRQQGYALDCGEYSSDVRCIAYPILGFQNFGVAAISVSMPVDSFTEAVLMRLAQELQRVGQLLSTQVGSDNPEAWRESRELHPPIRASLL
jgi:DNA-binding IclR family transcriptional regulator